MPSISLIRHVRNYASAGVISALVGLATFPMMTRNLSVDDYGIIGLITATTTLAVAFGKLGIQHAIVRYYSEAMHNRSGNNLLSFNSTAFILFGILSAVVLSLWLVNGNLIVPRFIDNDNIAAYFSIVSFFIVLRMLGSVTWNMLRARQHSGQVSKSTIIGRLSYLVLLLALLLVDRFNLYYLLGAFVLAEAAAVIYITRAYKPFFSFEWSAYSSTLTRQLLRFGLPLMVLESLAILLRLIDRYMIGSILGETQLGLYAASYNLSSYIEIVITASLAAAVRPMYTHIWVSEGKEATQKFLSQSLHIYLMLGIPFAALFILVGPDMLAFLAGDRYESGVSIIPYIVIVILFDGALIFLTAGQYFIGKTSTILFWGIASGLINLTGNYLVIPHYGIEGAAAVTMFAFFVFFAGVLNRSLRLLMFPLTWKRPLAILMISLLVFVILNSIDLSSPLLNLLVKGTLGGCLLTVVILVLDGQVREWLRHQLLPRLLHRNPAP